VRNSGTGKNFAYVSAQICLTIAAALLLMSTVAQGQACTGAPAGACVQENNSPLISGTATSASAAFTNAQGAGNLNVVVANWSDNTSSVTTVTDSNSNSYTLAATSSGPGVTQAIFYARNIVVGTTPNTITVNFNAPAGAPDVRILEYSGFTASSTVDDWSGGAGGASGTANSGTFATSTTSLLVGAGTTTGSFTASGAGYVNRGVNAFGDIVEDSSATVAAGSNSATATVVGAWVMQGVGFSVNGITGLSAPTVTGIAPASGPTLGGTAVTITGTNFAPGAIAFFGTLPSPLTPLLDCAVTSSTTLNCVTPFDNEGPKDLTVVNVDGQASAPDVQAYQYTVSSPTITGIAPAASTTDGGAAITITGTNFENGAKVNVGGALSTGCHAGPGLYADSVNVTSSTTITMNSPAFAAGSYDVTVVNPDQGSFTDSGALTYAIGPAPINYIQRGDAQTCSSAPNVTEQMPNPQLQGDLNVVIIGWADTTHQVSSVIDTEGNTYAPAIATVQGSSLSQAIYYAKNIKGDGATANTITVNFNGSASSPDVRILEYSGLDPNSPLDQGVSNAGSGTTADTTAGGTCTTTSAVEVVVAAATVGNAVTASGPNYTTVDFTPNGNDAEHQFLNSIGSCQAQAIIAAGGNWVIQSVSFKAPSSVVPGSFTITPQPPTSQSVVAGSSASYALTLAAQNGFNSAVTLACSGQPSGASCNFSPSNPITPGSSTPVTVTVPTKASTPAGTSTITITGTGGGQNHSAQVMLTVTANTAPGFSLAASALSPASVSPGATATSTITITGVNGFNADSVSLSCSSITGGGSPAPSCSFSALSGGTSTLTVSTTAPSSSKLLRSTGIFYAMLLPIGGMTLLGAGFTSRRKKLLAILLVCLAITGILFMVACGGGSSSGGGGGSGGTPAGTYTITVQGTASGATTQTQNLTLTVQ